MADTGVGKKGQATLELFQLTHTPHRSTPFVAKAVGAMADGKTIWGVGCPCGDIWSALIDQESAPLPVTSIGDVYGKVE